MGQNMSRIKISVLQKSLKIGVRTNNKFHFAYTYTHFGMYKALLLLAAAPHSGINGLLLFFTIHVSEWSRFFQSRPQKSQREAKNIVPASPPSTYLFQKGQISRKMNSDKWSTWFKAKKAYNWPFSDPFCAKSDLLGQGRNNIWPLFYRL